MAALSDVPAGANQPTSPALVELRTIEVDLLNPLLDEETSAWRAALDWDFRPSADLVRRFVHMQALNGFALLTYTSRGPRVDGYSYYVCEEGKGLIGDLYVRRDLCTPLRQQALLQAILDSLGRTPGLGRVEAQLMMLNSPLSAIPRFPFRNYPREFLTSPVGPATRLVERPQPGITIVRWTEALHDRTASLIASAYQGHIDSEINDQYRTPSGARRFLTNIVQYPGCGTFFGPASFAAFDTATKQLRGISLASLVADDCGHITQLCVAKTSQGTGLGYELMRQSMLALAAHSCQSVSLTVTAANEPAMRLYRSMGFSTRREFSAYVWDRRHPYGFS
jgi:ribosomal protein S18 acetylase RimI-like enzyme